MTRIRRPVAVSQLLLLVAVVAMFGASPGGAEARGRTWLALGDSYSSGEGIPGTTDDPVASGMITQGRDCQRATGQDTRATAWPVGAYERLRASMGFSALSFVPCTGAVSDEAASQILEAQAATGRRKWDVVSLSFGGNNLRFSEVIKDCIDAVNRWESYDVTSLGCDISEQELRERIEMLAGKRQINSAEFSGVITLPRLYATVARHVENGGDVLITGYPNIIEEVARWGWRRNLNLGCEFIQSSDVGMLRSVTGYLNEQIARSVEEADKKFRADGVRFHFIDIAHDPYEFSDRPSDRHGLCTHDQWLNGFSTGLTSGRFRVEASYHPNQKGHDNTARVVAAFVRGHVNFDDGVTVEASDDREIDVTAQGEIRNVGGFDPQQYLGDRAPRGGTAPTVQSMIEVFGPPASRGPFDPASGCLIEWPDLRLAASAEDFGGRSAACSDGAGVQSIRVGYHDLGRTDLEAERWTTDRGLAVGDDVSRLERLYPEAHITPGMEHTYDLISEPSPVGTDGTIVRLQAGVYDTVVTGFEVFPYGAGD